MLKEGKVIRSRCDGGALIRSVVVVVVVVIRREERRRMSKARLVSWVCLDYSMNTLYKIQDMGELMRIKRMKEREREGEKEMVEMKGGGNVVLY